MTTPPPQAHPISMSPINETHLPTYVVPSTTILQGFNPLIPTMIIRSDFLLLIILSLPPADSSSPSGQIHKLPTKHCLCPRRWSPLSSTPYYCSNSDPPWPSLSLPNNEFPALTKKQFSIHSYLRHRSLFLDYMSGDPFKVPYPVKKKSIHGLHNIQDTRAILRFCLAMESVLQQDLEESGLSSPSPQATPWTGARTGVTLTFPSLNIEPVSETTSTPDMMSDDALFASTSSDASPPSQHISSTSSSVTPSRSLSGDQWIGASSLESDDELMADLRASSPRAPPTSGPSTSTPKKLYPTGAPVPNKPPISANFTLPSTGSQDPRTSTIFNDTDSQARNAILIEAAENYEAAQYVLEHNFDSENVDQSLFDDAFFETDPVWTCGPDDPNGAPDLSQDRSQIIRGESDPPEELQDSTTPPEADATETDLLQQAMASIHDTSEASAAPKQSHDDQPPSPDLTDKSGDKMDDSPSPPLNTSKKRLHSNIESDDPDDPNITPHEKSRRLSENDDSLNQSHDTKGNNTKDHASASKKRNASSRARKDKKKQTGTLPRQSRDRLPPTKTQNQQVPPSAPPTDCSGATSSKPTTPSPDVSPIRGEKEKPPPSSRDEVSDDRDTSLNKTLQDCDLSQDEVLPTADGFQIDISKLVSTVRSHSVKIGASLGAQLRDDDPLVTVYNSEETRFSADDLLPPKAEIPDGVDTITFPELYHQKGAKLITLKMSGPVYFLLVARKPGDKSWSVPHLDLFLDFMNLIQSALLEQDAPFADALAWFNPWHSHDMGLVGIHPDNLEDFNSLRDFISTKLFDGHVYNTYPKDRIAKRYDFTAILKRNLRTFNMKVLTKAIFKKNPTLELKGDLLLHKSKKFNKREWSKQGESKADWRLALLSGSEAFMQSIKSLPNSHPFSVGSAAIQIRGGDRRRESRRDDKFSTDPDVQHSSHGSKHSQTSRDASFSRPEGRPRHTPDDSVSSTKRSTSRRDHASPPHHARREV